MGCGRWSTCVQEVSTPMKWSSGILSHTSGPGEASLLTQAMVGNGHVALANRGDTVIQGEAALLQIMYVT